MKLLLLIFILIPSFSLAEELDDAAYFQEAYEEHLADQERLSAILDYRLTDEHIFFGPEFTFWVPKLDQNGIAYEDGTASDEPLVAVIDYVNHLENHLVNNQPYELQFESKYYETSDRKFSFAEFYSQYGWSLVAKEDMGVIEVTMGPMTVQQFEENADAIQDAIFVSAENIGYPPVAYGGGGHINMSLGYLKKRPLLLRNFVVDLLNHNELFLGVFGFDTNNALSPSLLPEKVWKEIREALKFINGHEHDYDFVELFILELQAILSQSIDPYLKFWFEDAQERKKYNAVRFLRRNPTDEAIALDDRIELRAVRPQKDIYTWIRQTRLLEKRVKYLETLDYPIELKPIVSVDRLESLPLDIGLATVMVLTPPVDPQDALAAFHQYVTESGEKWEEHQDYLWPAWHADGDVEEFNQTLCSKLLEAES